MDSRLYPDPTGVVDASAFAERLRRFVSVNEPLSIVLEPFRPELVGPEPDDAGLRARIDRFALRQPSE